MTQVILDRYELTRRLGKGGMGDVWEAEDTRLRRTVAIKFLSLQGQSQGQGRGEHGEQGGTQEQRFLREAQFTAGFTHHGVPTIHDVGVLDDGRRYIVMERVHGRTLRQVIAEEDRQPPEMVARIVAEIADVLAYAHEQGVIHRDLKPSNLALRPDGSVAVLDFGIGAALTPAPGDEPLTSPYGTPGTPGYMAPEQARGEAVAASDLYALGCVAYELLAGGPPFPHDNPFVQMSCHLNDPVPKLRERRPEVPDQLAELVMSLLAKEPEERPASAALVRDRARRCATSPPEDSTAASGTSQASESPTGDAAAQRHVPAAPAAAVGGASIRATPRRTPGSASHAASAALARARALAAEGEHGLAAELLAPSLNDPVDDDGSVPVRLTYLEYLRLDGTYSRAYKGFTELADVLRRTRSAGATAAPEDVDDADLLACRIGAARCLSRLGRAPEALPLLEKLLPAQRRVLGAGHSDVLRTREEIGVLLAQRGDHRSGRDLLARLLDDLRGRQPPDPEHLRRVELLVSRLDELLGEERDGDD